MSEETEQIEVNCTREEFDGYMKAALSAIASSDSFYTSCQRTAKKQLGGAENHKVAVVIAIAASQIAEAAIEERNKLKFSGCRDTEWNLTAKSPPKPDMSVELIGFGGGVSCHVNGEYSIMRYDGVWWNEDGTEMCDTEPEYWAHLSKPTQGTTP